MGPTREAALQLSSEVSSLGKGRRFVADKLRLWGVEEERVEPVMLVANELIANAIVHARSAPLVRLEQSGSALLLRVSDGSPDLPVARPVTLDRHGGRGLLLVEALADRWGIDANSSGKTVWATFADTFV